MAPNELKKTVGETYYFAAVNSVLANVKPAFVRNCVCIELEKKEKELKSLIHKGYVYTVNQMYSPCYGITERYCESLNKTYWELTEDEKNEYDRLKNELHKALLVIEDYNCLSMCLSRL